jgi:hypothetical protein
VRSACFLTLAAVRAVARSVAGCVVASNYGRTHLMREAIRFLESKMIVATKKICFSMLLIAMSGGSYAQAGGGMADVGNGALVQGANGPGTPPGAGSVDDGVRASAGLTKGTDGIISSMRSNGTRTTESPNLRAPNRTGTMPAR